MGQQHRIERTETPERYNDFGRLSSGVRVSSVQRCVAPSCSRSRRGTVVVEPCDGGKASSSRGTISSRPDARGASFFHVVKKEVYFPSVDLYPFVIPLFEPVGPGCFHTFL